MFSPDYQLETNLFDDKDCQRDLGRSSVHDYLLDQEAGQVTVQVSPDLLLYRRVRYKEIPNFGISEICQSRPLPSMAKAMECEEVGRVIPTPHPW